MKEFIIEELRRLELDQGVEVLFAAESGSRAWGLENENSDYDIRFIYRRPIPYYLSTSHGYTTSRSENDTIEVKSNDFDISGWDVKKALFLFGKSNTSIYEWLISPTVYTYKNYFMDTLNTISGKYISPKKCIYHYVHLAQNEYGDFLKNDVVKVKKYLYTIRPLLMCEYIEKYKKFPPIKFNELLETMKENLDENIIIDILDVVYNKKSGVDVCKKKQILNDYIETGISYYKKYASEIKDIEHDWQIIDELTYVMLTVQEYDVNGTQEPPTDNSPE